jgi:glycosyltransferase involved in cell wall biosynthesis
LKRLSRLAIVTTHPVQYNAPLFALLSREGVIAIKVFYTWQQSEQGKKYDPGFGINITWDIPLLEGYEYAFVANVSAAPGTQHFRGIDNPGLKTAIEEWKPDAVLVFGWSFKSHLSCLRHFHNRIPVLFRGDSTLTDEKSIVQKAARCIFLKWIYSFVDYALYVGEANKAYFKAFGLRDSQLIFAPHAVDNERFGSVTEKQQSFIDDTRQKMGIKEGDITLLFCGKFQQKKEPILLLNAFMALNDFRLHLILVGNGELEKEIQQYAGDSANIHLMQFQNQSMMPAVYRLGDIFCLPSKGPGETWGLAVNEAMASGRAVIVSSMAGCAADLVKPGVNGYVFKSGDIHDLKDKILKVTAESNRLADMQQQSKKIINAYSFQNIVKPLQETVAAFGENG